MWDHKGKEDNLATTKSYRREKKQGGKICKMQEKTRAEISAPSHFASHCPFAIVLKLRQHHALR